MNMWFQKTEYIRYQLPSLASWYYLKNLIFRVNKEGGWYALHFANDTIVSLLSIQWLRKINNTFFYLACPELSILHALSGNFIRFFCVCAFWADRSYWIEAAEIHSINLSIPFIHMSETEYIADSLETVSFCLLLGRS